MTIVFLTYLLTLKFIKMNEANIYVAGNFGNKKIAKLLQGFYGRNVTIYLEENLSEKYVGKERFDLFLLPADLISNGQFIPKELKEKYGKNSSKVISIANSQLLIDQMKEGFDIDYHHLKSELNKVLSLTDSVEKNNSFLTFHLIEVILMRIATEIKDIFFEQKNKYASLAKLVIELVQETLKLQGVTKLVTNEHTQLPGGFEWMMKNEDKQAFIRLYYDGMVLIFLQSKLTQEEKTLLDTSRDYMDLSSFPDGTFHLTNELDLDKLIKRLKEHLI